MTLKTISLPAGACLLMAGLGLALPASATQWMAWDGQDEAAPQVIYTQDTDNHGAMLVCDRDGSLSAMISLSPATMPELLATNAPYARTADGSVSVGDQDAAETTFRYIPAIDAIETHAHSIAAKMFNAAVLGQPLNVSVRREGDIQAYLPAPDTTFKAFAKTCKTLREAAES